MTAEATGPGYARISVSVTVPGGIAGALSTSFYGISNLGVTVGAIGGKTISCTAEQETSENEPR